MIHFDFTVTEEEADTIFDAINDQIDYCLEEKADWVGSTSCGDRYKKGIESAIQWYEERIKYLKDLKSKMKNIKIGSEDY
jgi:hypothetical protein